MGCQYRPSPMPLWKSSVTRPLCHTNEVLMRDEPRRLLHRVMMWKLFKKTKKKPLNFRNMRDRGSRKWAAWKRHVTTSLCLPVWVLRKNLTELLLKCPKETQIDGYFLSFFFFFLLSVFKGENENNRHPRGFSHFLSRHKHRLDSMQAIDAHLFHPV